MAEVAGMHRINPGGDPAIWVFSDTVGEDEICGMAVARNGQAPETAGLIVSRNTHTQNVIYEALVARRSLYEVQTSLLTLGALRPGDMALDIGAHVGYFSMLFRLAVGPSGSVYSFEPMPDTYRRLLRNVVANRFTNVLPVPMALADHSGAEVFHINADNDGASSLLGSGAHTCQVQVTSLDDLFRDGLAARPRVMKIDVEGAELSVLQGGRRWFDRYAPDLVICEINRDALAGAGVSEHDIRDFFVARDYRCAAIGLGVSVCGLDLGGGQFYRYLDNGETVSDRCQFVFNLMCVRAGSGLYPAEFA